MSANGDKVINNTAIRNASKDVKSFIKTCLNPDWKNRKSALELLEHKWIKTRKVELEKV